MNYLTNLLFFDISRLYYYITVKPAMILCISSGDTYISLGISLSCSYVIVSELLGGELLEAFAILLEIWLPIKSTVASAAF